MDKEQMIKSLDSFRDNILNELAQADQILATIPVAQNNVFAMAAARNKLSKVMESLKAIAEKEEKFDG